MKALALAVAVSLAPLGDFASTSLLSETKSIAEAGGPYVVAVKSASRKPHRARRPAAPPPTWNGPDPTKGPGIERLHELQREGRCVVDEGYGRYTFCSDR